MQEERHGAAAVVIHEGQVLLARRINPPDAGLWGYPGGHVDPGETALQAAIRELHEETTIVATPVERIATLHVGEGGGPRFRLDMVLCRYVSGDPHPSDDVSDARWVPIHTALYGDLPKSLDVDTILTLALGRQ